MDTYTNIKLIRLIQKEKYDEASDLLTENELNDNYKKLSKILIEIDHLAPYLSSIKEQKIKGFLIIYIKGMLFKPNIKKEVIDNIYSFHNLDDAMKYLDLKKHKIKTEEEKEEIKIVKEIEKSSKEREIFTPETIFRPIPPTSRIGVVKGDVIFIGNCLKIQQALKKYKYKIDLLTKSQLVIRDVDLLGIIKHKLYKPSDNNLVKGKKHKMLWEKKLYEKYKGQPYLLKSFSPMIEKRFKNYAIVSNNTINIKDHYYIPVMPKTLISLPYCTYSGGKIIPIIYQWSILGI